MVCPGVNLTASLAPMMWRTAKPASKSFASLRLCLHPASHHVASNSLCCEHPLCSFLSVSEVACPLRTLSFASNLFTLTSALLLFPFSPFRFGLTGNVFRFHPPVSLPPFRQCLLFSPSLAPASTWRKIACCFVTEASHTMVCLNN